MEESGRNVINLFPCILKDDYDGTIGHTPLIMYMLFLHPAPYFCDEKDGQFLLQSLSSFLPCSGTFIFNMVKCCPLKV